VESYVQVLQTTVERTGLEREENAKFITVTEFTTRSRTPTSIKFHTTKPHKGPVGKMRPLNL